MPNFKRFLKTNSPFKLNLGGGAISAKIQAVLKTFRGY